MNNKIWPNDYFKVILNRRLQITEIKLYQSTHHNKLRPLACVQRVSNLIKGKPHPDDYDFESFLTRYSYNTLLSIFIMKYNKSYTQSKETYSYKYLKIKFPCDLVMNIDSRYLFEKKTHSIKRSKCSLNSSLSDYSRRSSTVVPSPILKPTKTSRPSFSSSYIQIGSNSSNKSTAKTESSDVSIFKKQYRLVRSKLT